MKKKIVFIGIIIALVTIASIYVYQTYADPVQANDSYTITLTGDTTVTVAANSSKKVIYQIKNTTNGTVNYGIGYSSENNNTAVKVYYNSTDTASGSITVNGYKNVTLAAINNSNASATINISTILGYENGGNLIIPSGTTQVTEIVYNAAEYITSLYTNAQKSTATVNNITYNLASSVGLMNDRHASMSTGINGGDIRYYGADPNNYVWLGDTYTSTCTSLVCGTARNSGDRKLYRIIGVFGDKLRVITEDSIGYYSWDTSASSVNSGLGINQWGPSGSYQGADLMKLLNPGYENNQDLNSSGNTITVNNSLYWNKASGTCYAGSSYSTKSCDFTNVGLSDNEKNKIATETWYLGGIQDFYFDVPSSIDGYVDMFYNYERSSNHVANPTDGVVRQDTWLGKIGLPYFSDVGYAGDLSTNINCYYYDDDFNTNCADNWLDQRYSEILTITPNSNCENAYWEYSTEGFSSGNACSNQDYVFPTFFLNSNMVITNGNGSRSNPYTLG